METVSAIPSAQASSGSVPGSLLKLPVPMVFPGYAENLSLPTLVIQITGSGVSGSYMGGCFLIVTSHIISVHFRKLSGCLVYSG